MKGHTLLKCFFFTFLGYDGPPGWVEESFAAYLHVCLFFFIWSDSKTTLKEELKAMKIQYTQF